MRPQQGRPDRPPAAPLAPSTDRQQSLRIYAGISSRPVLAAALGALAIAFSAILVRVSGASPLAAAVYRCAYAVPVLWTIARLEDRRFGPRPFRGRLLAAAAGALLAADLVLWHRAIVAVGAGLATVLANLQVVVVALPAALTSALLLVQPAASVGLARVLLDEVPTRLQLLGVALILAGVLLATSKPAPKQPSS